MQRPSPNFRSEEYFLYEIFEETFYSNVSLVPRPPKCIDREGLGKRRTGTGQRGGHKKGEEEEGKEEREKKRED